MVPKSARAIIIMVSLEITEIKKRVKEEDKFINGKQ
jgi:hypothetical protein